MADTPKVQGEGSGISAQMASLPFEPEREPLAIKAGPDGKDVLLAQPDDGWEVGREYLLRGKIRRVRFQSPDGLFVIASLALERGQAVVIRGNLGQVAVGDVLQLTGRWVQSKYGEQLDVTRCEPVLPVTIDGIAKFLAAQVHGVGPRLAARIVEHFGEATLDILDRAPERLAEIEGIGTRKRQRIIDDWRSKHGKRNAMLFLQSHGVPLGMAARIVKHYGDEAPLVVRDDPYRLARDVRGVGFHSADKIAASLGIPPDAPERLDAGLVFALHEAGSSDGHCYLTTERLAERASRLLSVEPTSVLPRLETLAEKGRVVVETLDDGERAVFAQREWRAEVATSEGALRLMTADADTRVVDKSGEPADVGKLAASIERAMAISLASEQRQAIELGLTGKVTVVTGGPGTGKTTLVRVLVEAAKQLGWPVKLAAPTGRAAKRLSEATGEEARTIHRLLEFSFQAGGFLRGEETPLDSGLMVVDEVSMIDIHLMRALLQALPSSSRLVLVGDVDQLPSVGPGTVLADFIESRVVPVVRLTEVFRQAEASLIVRNAHRINRGETPILPARDSEPIEYYAVNVKRASEAESLIVHLVTERIPKAFGLDPMRDIQVLCPMRVREAGSDSLNLALQAALNPDGKVVGRGDMAIRIGDRVMQLRNDYEKDVYNGDVGRVERQVKATKEIVVDFEGRRVRYGREELDALTLAYACTIHKSQGSEYPAVVVPLLRSQYRMLQRNLVYTALTRARSLAMFVGQPSAMRIAVSNDRPALRNTRLAARLQAGVAS